MTRHRDWLSLLPKMTRMMTMVMMVILGMGDGRGDWGIDEEHGCRGWVWRWLGMGGAVRGLPGLASAPREPPEEARALEEGLAVL